MRATRRFVGALALTLAAAAPSTARAQQAPPAGAPEPPRLRLPTGAPPDPAAFPAVPAAAAAAPATPGVELHGFAAGWWSPWSEPSPTQARDAFRLRFGVLRADAQLGRNVSVLARLGLMVPGSPLLDFAVTWQPHDAFGVTAGQFRLPLGASATTLAPQLVMLDRPGYVYSMTKVAFRDVGVMLQSSPRGVANGLVHYWLVAANGAGRVGVGQSRAPGPVENYLYAARVLFDPGRLFLRGPQDRLALGLSYAHSHDPAIHSGDAAADRDLATHTLGRTLAPIASERVTQLAGADLTLALAGVWAQAEVLYLHARPVGAETSREALGASLELAYTLPVRPFDLVGVQVAARGERFDPDLATSGDELLVGSVGVNVMPIAAVRASVFGSITRFNAPMTGEGRTGGELTARLAAAF